MELAVRLRVLVGVAATCAATIAACKAFSSSDDPNADGAEAGARDGAEDGARDGASQDGAEAAPNLLVNGDFELGCAGWAAINGKLTDEDTNARSGAHACRVCNTTDAGFLILQVVQRKANPGERLFAEAYVRAAEGGVAPVAATHSSLQTLDAKNIAVEGLTSTGPVVEATWQRTSTLLNVTKPAVQLQLSIGAGTTGACLVIDDARVYVAP